MRNKKTQWFVETDARSNDAVARMLAKNCLQHGNDQIELFDNNGIPHSVWQLPDYKTVSLLLSAQKQFSFKMKIFNRQNPRGLIREWTFYKKKKFKKLVF